MKKGQKYLTLVYQIDSGCKRLLWIGSERTQKTLTGFFDWLTPDRSRRLKFACSDMWKPYLNVIAKKAAQAVHVLDRFHIMAHMNKAIDKVRAQDVPKAEGRRARAHSDPRKVVPAKATEEPHREARGQDRRHPALQPAVHSQLPAQGRLPVLLALRVPTLGRHLPRSVVHSGPPFTDRAHEHGREDVRTHRELILNWFKAKGTMSSGTLEGLNGKAKLTMRRAYGFRSLRVITIALYHTLGKLPEPALTHRFC